MKQSDPKYRRAYERGVLRSAFVSLFWSIIAERKKRQDGFTFQALAKSLSTNKAEVSRWFNGDPNWTVNTIASVADALDVDITIQARDRKTGAIFTPAGVQSLPSNTSKSAWTVTERSTPLRIIKAPSAFAVPPQTESRPAA